MKRLICIVNAVLAFVLFLATFGYVFFLYGRTYYMNGSDLGIWIFLAVLQIPLFFLSVYLIHNKHRSKIPLLSGAVFSLIVFVIIGGITAVLLITDNFKGISPQFWSTLIVPLIMSGLYLFAAFKKENV